MSVKSKIFVAALAALFVVLLLILWGVFVFLGRTPIDPLINQITALITIVVGLVSAFFGHQARSSAVAAQGADAAVPSAAPTVPTLAAPAAPPAVPPGTYPSPFPPTQPGPVPGAAFQ
ncbi:hypothetical protein [Paraburkholderia sp. J41]|uniref:hypothetical protein n=1 Tax=Paraburkholderia sp. J41 TaxID=2805433 RepID=UPI002AC31610|nr:hypothetical protein [Paraburkholderia sp. J41]